MDYFWEGFNKEAKARWQKAWSALSGVSKQRLRRYAGSGVKDVSAMREGMFMPKHSPRTLARRNQIDKRIYDAARTKRENILRLNSKAMPYAIKEPGSPAIVALPKNPSAGTQTRAKTRPDLRGAEGVHNRAILEHETSEGFMEGAKAKRGDLGRWARTQKAIQENDDVVHSSAHPLIAETNIAGRHPKALRDLRQGWSETPAQGKMYSILKQHGWTPEQGLPLYGKQAKSVQSQAEKAFAPHFKEHFSKKVNSAVKRFRGKALKEELSALKREAKEYAGGNSIPKKR